MKRGGDKEMGRKKTKIMKLVFLIYISVKDNY
jgi:hypothetical protein